MTKLFKKKPPEQNKTVSFLLRLTPAEDSKIRHAASIRNLSTSDFIRRASLGRRADVRYETEIVLALCDVVREIRKLYAAMVEQGIQPPEDDWRPLITEAVAAMHRISK